MWMTSIALISALILAVLAGLLLKTSLLLGLISLILAIIVVYLNLPLALTLKHVRLPRPLPRIALAFWAAAFSAFNLPQTALVHLNNRITGNLAVQANQAHVLVSRCLQRSDCTCAVTADIANCKECGRCKIGAVKDICRQRNLSVTVESGGTAARLRLKQKRPSLVVAVACQRELLAGILDTRIPVVGVVVEPGPKPCTDCDLTLANFAERINRVIKEE